MTAPPWTAGRVARHLRQAMRFAETTLRLEGDLETMFALYTADSVNLIPARWRNDDEKRRMQNLVRLLAVAHDAQAVTLVGQIWGRIVERHPRESEAELQARIRAVPPREAEDRHECVLVVHVWRDGAGMRQVDSAVRDIERGPDGRVTGLATRQRERGTMSGALLEVMPAAPPSVMERMLARSLLTAMGAPG